jgi:hypothetical protein
MDLKQRLNEGLNENAKVPKTEKDIVTPGYYQWVSTIDGHKIEREIFVREIHNKGKSYSSIKFTYVDDGTTNGKWFTSSVKQFLKYVIAYYPDAGKSEPDLDR